MSRRLPAEWEPHARTWMAWPCREEIWFRGLPAAQAAFVEVAHAIARFEPVTMLAPPFAAGAARDRLGSDIEVVEMPIDDSWTRDTAPSFVIEDGALKASCFTFNAWGGKYEPHADDAEMGRRIAAHLGLQTASSDLTFEGGGLSTDGEGTLLVTESCLMNPNRNPGWSRDEIDAELTRLLGVEKVIWLPGDWDEEETDGHVDGIAVFAGPGRVMIETPGRDPIPWADALHANRAALEGQTDAKGRPIELIPIEPASAADPSGERFCTAYVNFYICNGAVIAPAYGIEADARTRDLLEDTFPGREVVQVMVPDIAIGGGGIHCITHEEPALA